MFKSKFKLLSSLLILALATQLTSCGYLLYKDRRGQKASSELDWPIVGLDAIGLLFFVLPGAIAFAIDFTSGTIYLPNGKGAAKKFSDLENATKIKLSANDFNQEKIAALIKERTNVDFSFSDPKLQIQRVN